MHETVAAERDEVATLCREVRVRRLDVFGSAVGGQFDPDTSDVDVVVDFAGAIDFDRFFALKEGLEAIFGRSVDVVLASGMANPYFRQQVIATRELLYAA